MILDYLTYPAIALLIFIFLSQAIRILREYERGVVFTLGRFTGVKGPGLIILIPVVQQIAKVDLRVMVQVVPPQDVISRDNVSVKVNAVLYFRIIDPERAIIKVGDYMAATSQLAQTTLRSIAKQAEAERLRRAKVINAMGEQQAAEKLVEAGRTLAREPQAMQLRYFAALHDIAGERSSTVVFPLPMDLLGHLTVRRNETT